VFALVFVEGLDPPLRDVSKSAVQRSQRRGIERWAAGVSRVAEVFQPYAGQIRLVVRELVDQLVKRVFGRYGRTSSPYCKAKFERKKRKTAGAAPSSP
jgi:hypothetical protein